MRKAHLAALALVLSALVIPGAGPLSAVDLGIPAEHLLSASVSNDGSVVILHQDAAGDRLARFDAVGSQVWSVAAPPGAQTVRTAPLGGADIALTLGSNGYALLASGVVVNSGQEGVGLSPSGSRFMTLSSTLVTVRDSVSGADVLTIPIADAEDPNLDYEASEKFIAVFGQDDRSVLVTGVDPVAVDSSPPVAVVSDPQWIQTFDLVEGTQTLRRIDDRAQQVVAFSRERFAWLEAGEVHYQDPALTKEGTMVPQVSWARERPSGYSRISAYECNGTARILAVRPYSFADLFDEEGALLAELALPYSGRATDMVATLEPSRASFADRSDFDPFLTSDCALVLATWKESRVLRVDDPEQASTVLSSSLDGRPLAQSPDWRYLLVDVGGSLHLLTMN